MTPTPDEDLLAGFDPTEIRAASREIQWLSLKHFGRSQQDGAGSRELRYPDTENAQLTATFSRRGELLSLVASSTLESNERDQLREAIASELSATEIALGRLVLFHVGAPVEGWWRYRDRFQLLPAPPNAPRIENSLGRHPFLIEFVYRGASTSLVDSQHRTNEAVRLAMLLNALLPASISTNATWRLGGDTHEWVYLPTEESDAPVKSAYLQRGYTAEGIGGRISEFTPVGEMPPLETGAALSGAGPLTIANELTDWLDAYYAVTPVDQVAALQVSFWLAAADRATSWSMMLLCCVSAVEVMIPPGDDSYRAAYAAFLTEYVPELKANWSQIYDRRSAVVHGDKLFLSDLTESLGVPSPAEWNEQAEVRLTLEGARLTLGRWLVRQAAETSD